MPADIIAIGDELTSGQRLDTNSQWLSQRLGELGVPVAFHTTVGDDLEANVAVFRAAIDRADFVVATGGLGPTADDLTRDALALAAGVDLVQDDAALAHIRNLFARRGRPMPERNALQAQFPRGSRPIPNPHGTAPGIDFTVPRGCGPPCRVFALPGVPAEMFAMWEASVAPAIRSALPTRRVICHRRIKCFGVGESDVEAMLPDMIRRKREPLVGITVSDATITLRITASGPNDTACRKAMESTIAQIRELLGVLVFGEEEDELEDAVVRLLRNQQKTLAVAEWATGGLISKWLAQAASESNDDRFTLPVAACSLAPTSHSNTFRGGIVVSDPATLQSLLGLTIRADDAALASTAEAMARAICERTSADYGLSVAAFPPLSDDSHAAPPRHRGEVERTGRLQVALATADNVRVKAFPLAAHPAIVTARAAKQALNMLRLAILNQQV
jgi:nicotinamide-nucleotide amidase